MPSPSRPADPAYPGCHLGRPCQPPVARGLCMVSPSGSTSTMAGRAALPDLPSVLSIGEDGHDADQPEDGRRTCCMPGAGAGDAALVRIAGCMTRRCARCCT